MSPRGNRRRFRQSARRRQWNEYSHGVSRQFRHLPPLTCSPHDLEHDRYVVGCFQVMATTTSAAGPATKGRRKQKRRTVRAAASKTEPRRVPYRTAQSATQKEERPSVSARKHD